MPPAIVWVWLLIGLAGCRQEMADQPRVETYESAAFFTDGLGYRPQVAGTVARGQTWQASAETTGKEGREYVSNPQPMSRGLLERGRLLFDINCQHCHGRAGYGDGMVVRRGFPKPPSYHIDRLREVPDGRLFEVITIGHGRMPALGPVIAPEDRWTIVGYVRALQLSQQMKEFDLSDADRTALSSMANEEAAQ